MNTTDASNNAAVNIGDIDPETVAHWLERSGNYKVLRRIQMRDTFGGNINSPVKVLVVDTETTGLDYASCEVIEVGALLIEVDQDTGEIGAVLGSFGGLEEPKVPITAENSAIHGITNDMVKGQRFDESTLKLLAERFDHRNVCEAVEDCLTLKSAHHK